MRYRILCQISAIHRRHGATPVQTSIFVSSCSIRGWKRDIGIKEITLVRGKHRQSKRVEPASFYQRGSKWAPPLEKMKAILKQFLAHNPEYHNTNTEAVY
jgi:hypothetical protein